MTTRRPLASVARSTSPRSPAAVVLEAGAAERADSGVFESGACVAGVLQPATTSAAASTAARIRTFGRILDILDRSSVGSGCTKDGADLAPTQRAMSRAPMLAILPHR